ncbi:GAF domain-containing SpoIIE family protein phosphatase [Streptomyces sp. gb14]|uniref:GAF domain-containing SpoIIE family protein phosphatase n=1 Tax=Streptomyces sp. gb14 TaxID=1827753 RepID=UPI000BEF4DF4|nr:GAF domain-containing SpoIIE family protein phosphatase [Streptomyces sp. gb14]
MDRFARLAARVLAAPEAVVAVTTRGPGDALSVEIVECWPPQPSKTDPVRAALCRHVVRAGELVMVDDLSARDDGPGRAAAGTAVGAFAGVPLFGEQGVLLGVLAVYDSTVRPWDAGNRQDLEDLADAAAAELQLRASAARAHQERRGAELAQQEAERATGHARQGVQDLRTRLDRSELLLRAAELLASTSRLDEVRSTVSELVSGDLKPAYVGLVLRGDDDMMRRSVDTRSAPVALEEQVPLYSLAARWPTAQAARENRLISVPDRQTLVQDYDPQTVTVFDQMGLASAVCVPLPGTRRPTLGTLVAAWDEPHETDVHERAVLTVIAGYTAMAVERALHLDERISVARQLQQAMLTDLPDPLGIELAALYRPAASEDWVGGDWYDAYPLLAGQDADTMRTPLAVTVGDVTGHNTRAATLMGQARSMLRQADIERANSPADALASFERANQHLRTGISGTLIHAHLLPRPEGTWLLRWTNAGHPPPLLARPGRESELLTDHGIMLHPNIRPRTDRPVHERLLEPGDVLLLYTDGLIEHRGQDFDLTLGRAARLLSQDATNNAPLDHTINKLADTLAGPKHSDDIVLLALRIGPRTVG